MKKLYVSGCSHVFGHGFPDCIDGTVPSKYAWPAIIEKQLDCKIINHSWPGNSADSMCKDFLNYQEKESLDAIVVMFPYRVRCLVRGKANEDSNFCAKNIDRKWFKKHDKYDNTLAYYATFIKHEQAEENNYLGNVTIFDYYAKKLNIPIWIGFTNILDEELARKKLKFNKHFVWEEWCMDNNYSFLPDGHWGAQAHIDFSMLIKKWLFKHKFNSR